METTWKRIAVIVAIVIVVAIVTTFLSKNWCDIVNQALCTIQSNIGLKYHFHIPNAGSTWACNALGNALN
jgi:hypothetical protein